MVSPTSCKIKVPSTETRLHKTTAALYWLPLIVWPIQAQSGSRIWCPLSCAFPSKLACVSSLGQTQAVIQSVTLNRFIRVTCVYVVHVIRCGLLRLLKSPRKHIGNLVLQHFMCALPHQQFRASVQNIGAYHPHASPNTRITSSTSLTPSSTTTSLPGATASSCSRV